jgi:hypothetical protein
MYESVFLTTFNIDAQFERLERAARPERGRVQAFRSGVFATLPKFLCESRPILQASRPQDSKTRALSQYRR